MQRPLPPPVPPAEARQGLDELAAGRRLSPKAAAVARFLDANPRQASFSSASQIAEATSVNVATVVRLAQSLGFSGWPEFQIQLRHRYLGTLLPSELAKSYPHADSLSSFEEAVVHDIQNLQALLSSVSPDAIDEVARAIASARKTLVISSGSHSAVGLIFSHLAGFMRYNVAFEHRGGPHVVGELNRLEPGDCLIAISFWRLVKDVVRATEHARERGVRTIAITDSTFSRLAAAAELVLIVPTESTHFFQSLTAAVSVTYGVLIRLYELGGEDAAEAIVAGERMFEELGVLYQ
jgi:DNA-binding MurR/RpiR family transcriptional regulator